MNTFFEVLFIIALIAAAVGIAVCTKKLFGPTMITEQIALVGIICLIGLGINVIGGTSQMEESLAPLKERFMAATLNEPEHKYASRERGSVLDYGGSLDFILSERDRLTEEKDMLGILVNWHTDGDSADFSGIYFHGMLALCCIMFWPLTILAFYYLCKLFPILKKPSARLHRA